MLITNSLFHLCTAGGHQQTVLAGAPAVSTVTVVPAADNSVITVTAHSAPVTPTKTVVLNSATTTPVKSILKSAAGDRVCTVPEHHTLVSLLP